MIDIRQPATPLRRMVCKSYKVKVMKPHSKSNAAFCMDSNSGSLPDSKPQIPDGGLGEINSVYAKLRE